MITQYKNRSADFTDCNTCSWTFIDVTMFTVDIFLPETNVWTSGNALRLFQNIAEKRIFMRLYSSMADKIQKQTEEYERMKWDLQCRIQELEGELTLQRQVMTAAFVGELRQREHGFNLKIDEMRAVLLSCDLKVKLLSKETEVHCQAQLQSTEALKASKVFCEQIKAQLQNKDHEIKDLTAFKDYKIKELESKLKKMETKEENIHIKKFEDVVWALKECEAHLETQYQALTEPLQKIEKCIVKLHGNMEVLAAQVCCIQKDQQEAMEQKDETIQRLRTEVEATQTGWDKKISQFSSEMVVKDTEMQERATKFRIELERSREEMERYKQQLSAGLKREKVLEQRQVHVELEWQRRCEDMKAQHYLANEQLIRDLTQARDQAKAELQEKEQDLQDLTVLLRSVKTERDKTLQVDCLESEEIRCLQQQNNILRAVVTQMRNEMEGIHLLPYPQAEPSSPQPVQHPRAPASTSNTQIHTGPSAQSTDISFKVSTADVLCLEKRDNTSALEKMRVAHMESTLVNLKEQSAPVRQLQVENQYLRRQQASGRMSSVVFENVIGAKSNPPVLHTRLKQAAYCIARLSREKQQLIEMGNRFRAQITTAGLQVPVEPERDSSIDRQGNQHDRLFALEQLQYQLTTQELQYALRQRACTFAEQLLPETNNQGPATEGAANPGSQGHKTTNRTESSKSEESQSQSLMELQPLSGLSRSLLSSEESLRSLKELWEILDRGFSPSILSEGEAEVSRRQVTESGDAGVQMTVHGISASIHSQPATEVQQKRNPYKTPSKNAKTSGPGSAGRICKIRNYNVKN